MDKKPFLDNLSSLKIVLVLFFLGLIAYANAINHPFVHDEHVFIVNNPYISDLNLKNVFFQTSVFNPSFPLVNTYYRPMLEVLNRIIYALFGLNPAIYHLINVLFHVLNGIVVFYLLERICFNNNIFLRERKALALSVAVLFLVHPVQSEAVACISGISNLIFFFLSALSLYFYVVSFSYFAPIKERLNKERSKDDNKSKGDGSDGLTSNSAKNKKQNAVMYLSKEQVLSSPLLARHITKNGVEKASGSPVLVRKFNKNKYLISLFVFLLALFVKEQAVVLPFLILFYALCFFKNKKDIVKDWRVFAGYFIVLLSYLLFRKILFGHSLTSSSIFNEEFSLRLLSIPRTLLMYLKILFIPTGLHYYRCTDMLGPVIVPSLILILILGITVFAVIKLHQPEKRLAIFGFGFFFISLAPTLNIVPLVNEYSLLLTSEHFLYMPILGIIVLISVLANSLFLRKFSLRRVPLSLISVIFISTIFLALTIKQNFYWKNEIALFERTLKYENNFARVRHLLGKAYYSDGQYEKAMEEFEKSVRIMQGYIGKVKQGDAKKFYISYVESIYIDMAHCSEALGKAEDTAFYYGKALELDPKNSLIYKNMGLNSLKDGDINKAIKFYEKAFEINNNDLMTANSLAICYSEIGDLKKAEKMLTYIVNEDPGSISARENLNKFLSGKK